MRSTSWTFRGGILLGALVALNGFALLKFNTARDEAVTAIRDADLCEQVANRIAALRSKPVIAGSVSLPADNLSRRIEAAVRGAGVAGDDLASIEPDPASRIGDSSYLEKPTTIQLRNVSLTQVAQLLCALAGDAGGLRVKSLRLTTPPQEQSENLWSCEFTLSYLIYSPLAAPRQRS
jgi:hypothetical protein